MNYARRYEWVLSIYATARGFGFVLFEGTQPFDWGIKEVRGEDRNESCLQNIAGLLEQYEPQALVLRGISDTATRRAKRIRKLNAAMEALAEARGIPVFVYSRVQIRQCFGHLGSATKHAIAEAIATHIPAFERYLPPVRTAWMNEDARMALFDAVSLALVFFQIEGGRRQLVA